MAKALSQKELAWAFDAPVSDINMAVALCPKVSTTRPYTYDVEVVRQALAKFYANHARNAQRRVEDWKRKERRVLSVEIGGR